MPLLFFVLLGLAIGVVALLTPEEQHLVDEWEEFLAGHTELIA